MSRSFSPIDQLIEQAQTDKHYEPDVVRALLQIEVYAHVPKHDDTGRLRFIQFVTPEGRTVLPFFTDESQAQAATGDSVRIVRLNGRQLLEATRGATLMLNPNKTPCTLYPEEIAALLDHDEVANMESEVMPERQMLVAAPDPVPTWLIEPLISLYKTLDCVVSAYVAEIRFKESPETKTLLIVVSAATIDAERAARASITTLQSLCEGRDIGVDLTVFEPGSPPAWLADSSIKSFYSKVTEGSAIH